MARQKINDRTTRRGLRQILSELIDGPRRLMVRWKDRYSYTRPTLDPTRSDYRFWDKARRCKAEGLELSGLLLRPLESKIAAWVLGQAPKWKLPDAYTEEKVNQWYTKNLPSIIKAYRDSVGLGDGVAVINADLSVTVVSPNLVEPIVNQNDYSELIGWRIIQSYANPDSGLGSTDVMTFVDEYYDDLRVRKQYKGSSLMDVRNFTNLSGEQQVIFIPNNNGSDELFGRAEGEALVPALQRYGAILEAACEGNERQGRPVPVIKKFGSMSEVNAFWERFGRIEEQTLPDGTVEKTNVLDLDSDNVITLSGDGEFSWEAPGLFAGDSQVLLTLLFYLVLQHSEIPEFVWGNGLQGSRASAETQLGPFVKWIEMRRGNCLSWLTQMMQVVLEIMSLTDPRIKTDELPVPRFAPLTEKDGRLTKDVIAFALDNGLITKKTALENLPVEVENVAGELKAATKEQDVEREKAEEAAMRQAEQEAILNAASRPAPTAGKQSAEKPGKSEQTETPPKIRAA